MQIIYKTKYIWMDDQGCPSEFFQTGCYRPEAKFINILGKNVHGLSQNHSLNVTSIHG